MFDLRDLSCTLNGREHTCLNTFAQVFDDIIYLLFEHRIIDRIVKNWLV